MGKCQSKVVTQQWREVQNQLETEGGKKGVYISSFLMTMLLLVVPFPAHREGDFVLWDSLGAQRLAPLTLGTEAGIHETLTHPVQAAQVLHHVLVCLVVIVDDGMLFVHTARLQQQIRDKTIS